VNIQAEVSLYPLKKDKIGAIINGFIDDLREQNLEVTPGPMSTRISGDCAKVFAALAESFAGAARQGQTVLIAKVSNACPLE